MLSIGDYIKLILQKRGMTLTKLAEEMTELEKLNGNNETIYKQHLSRDLGQGKISITRARKIEVALNLPKFQLVNMINPTLSEKQIKHLEEIYKINKQSS